MNRCRFAAALLVVAAFVYYILTIEAVQAYFLPLVSLAVGYLAAKRFA